jgi:hypothetical protein
MVKTSITKAKQPASQTWLYVAPKGKLTQETGQTRDGFSEAPTCGVGSS